MKELKRALNVLSLTILAIAWILLYMADKLSIYLAIGVMLTLFSVSLVLYEFIKR